MPHDHWYGIDPVLVCGPIITSEELIMIKPYFSLIPFAIGFSILIGVTGCSKNNDERFRDQIHLNERISALRSGKLIQEIEKASWDMPPPDDPVATVPVVSHSSGP